MTNPADKSAEIDKWVQLYGERRPLLVKFTAKLKTLIVELLMAAEVDVILVESRTKEVASFADKLRRRPSDYTDPLSEMPDLCGVRVITYYTDDVAKVGSLLVDEFSIDDSVTRRSEPDDDDLEFGYTADHYVISLNAGRVHLGEWRPYAQIRAEIQVRSALQHAWSAVSHKLVYKREETVPTRLRRRLSRLSALFELADEQFLRLREESEELTTHYRERLLRGDLTAPIDALSVSIFLDDPEVSHAITSLATAAGWRPPIPKVSFEKLYQADREDLIEIVTQLGFNDLASLRGALADERLVQFASILRDLDQEAGGSVEATPEDIIGRVLAGLYSTDPEWLYEIYPRGVASCIVQAAELTGS